MIGVLKLLMQASKLELAYLKAKGYDSNYEFTKNEWIQKIAKVKSKMIAIDNLVASKYNTQTVADVDRVLSDHSNLNTDDFANTLYNFLTKKYFWRDWMVVVYKDITGNDNHYLHQCGGVIRQKRYGKNIVVSSVDKHKHAMDHTKAQHIMTATVTQTKIHR